MQITFRQGSEVLSEKGIVRAREKLTKLSHFIPENTYEAHAYIDIERESGAHNSESLWRASVNLDLAGTRMNASATGSTAEKAADQAVKELAREVQRSRAKHHTLRKRGAGFIKRLRQRFS